jgi:SAM-dependent methyltransferase
MYQNDNIKYWRECWKATTSAVQIEPDENKVAERWNQRWEKRSERQEDGGPGEEMMKRSSLETIGFLEENGFEIKGSKILDIGCGPGVLSIPLARLGAEVTSLDISSKSLERVKEAAEKESLDVETMVCSWWSADIDELGLRNKYDLVIASRTPSINDADTLEKMMACSKNLCYYSSFLNVGENREHMEIMKLLSGEEKEPGERMRHRHHQAYTMFFPFMYLYFSRYRPVVKINQKEREAEVKWEDAAEKAIRFFGHGKNPDDETKDKIRNYYMGASENGMYRNSPSGCHGMMIWDVNGR